MGVDAIRKEITDWMRFLQLGEKTTVNLARADLPFLWEVEK